MRALPLLLVGLLFATAAARAHPIHTSLAEADYNPKTQKLEIALRVFADDFERALSSRAGRKLTFEKTPTAEFNALAFDYVKEYFGIKLHRSAVSLTWIGRELKDSANELWLYLEAPLPEGVEGVKLRHALLAEAFSDQLNSIRVRDGSRQVTLVFPFGQGERTVKFAP